MSYTPTVRVSTSVTTTEERKDPEILLRKAVRLTYGKVFEPFDVTFFTNYRVIEQYHDAKPTNKFLEVLAKMTCTGDVGREFSGEVILSQRIMTGNAMSFEDCDLHNLGQALQQYVNTHLLPQGEPGERIRTLVDRNKGKLIEEVSRPRSVFDGFNEIDEGMH